MKTVCSLLLALFTMTALASGKPETTNKPPQVLLQTSMGDITLELDEKKSPKTVANFLQYVNEGFYNNTLFHRVIPDFMIQGGGMQPGMVEKKTRTPIPNESFNGVKNVRGTVVMARTQHPDSATAQFFINLVDNHYLDASGTQPGYAVFGHVTKGLDVLDKIAKVQTAQRGMHGDVPVQDVLIISARQLP